MEEIINLRCKRCDTIIPAENIDREQQLARCLECNALFRLVSERDIQPFLHWPDIALPKRLKVESLGSELRITYRWFGLKYLYLTFFCLVWNSGLLGTIFTTWNFWLLLLPHLWIGVGLAYYVLTGMINKTTISLTPDLLKIEHGPLPYFGNKRLDPISLKQLYVKQKTHRNKGAIQYSYEIYSVTWQGRDKKLLGGLEHPDQAFFLEQEMERFLGIKDKPIPGEYAGTATHYHPGIKWDAWEKLAKANKLTFTRGKLLTDYRIFGNYQGYHLNMMAFQKKEESMDISCIRVGLASDPSSPSILTDDKTQKRGMSNQKVTDLLASLAHDFSRGHFQTQPGGREISFEQPGLETNTKYLERLFDMLRQIIEAYPQIVALGGEVVPILRESAIDAGHPARVVAVQLLQAIASTTHPFRPKISSLVCKRCLVHYGLHEVKLPGSETLTICGCQACWQSRDFFDVESVIAVLDRRLSMKVSQQDQQLRVNWLSRRELFDFDQIEIIDASDEAVERFAVQVGNDTHPLRQPRYKEMKCLVAKECRLSQNSLHVLKHTFGQVTLIHK